MTTTAMKSTALDPEPVHKAQSSESYFQLVWRRFRRSKASVVGGLIVLLLLLLAIFAEFFAP